jgi:hypothetical protein
MKIKELIIENYEVFMPKLKTLPYTHRYWIAFRDKYFPHELVIDDRVARLIEAQLVNVLNRTRDMTDDEFEDCECSKKPCLAFHDPQYPIIRLCDLDEEYRLEYTPIEDNRNGKLKVKLINKSSLDNPLVLDQDIFYGNIKMENRYKDDTKKEIETVIEEV